MGSAPHQHQFEDCKRERPPATLRHISEGQGSPARVPFRGRLAIDLYRPSVKWPEAEHCLEQCRFAFAIATEHAQHLTRTDIEADVAANDPPGIAVAQIFDGQPR